MLCMDTHQDFREHGWNANPFNAANGGPCKTAGEWFTDETARNYYKKRLRYTVARWGYSPNVLCWEFGNEFEGWANSSKEIQLAWHREMSDYLRALDPFGHLITTSFWTNTGPEEFWNLKNLDIVQTHCYTNDDANVADRVRLYCRHQWRHFEKPHLFGEFGIRSHATTADKDPQGWGIHNSLWAGLANFTAGGVMPWWHENYLDTLDLYFHFTSLANFTEGLPLGTARWQPLVTAPAEYIDKNRKPETRDVAIIPVGGWERSQQNEFTISPAGLTSDDPIPQRMLHGAGHRDLKNPPTFVVTYPQPGRFIVHVGRVSASGLLRIDQVVECVGTIDRHGTAEFLLDQTRYGPGLPVAALPLLTAFCIKRQTRQRAGQVRSLATIEFFALHQLGYRAVMGADTKAVGLRHPGKSQCGQ